jgi:hypothetical protein
LENFELIITRKQKKEEGRGMKKKNEERVAKRVDELSKRTVVHIDGLYINTCEDIMPILEFCKMIKHAVDQKNEKAGAAAEKEKAADEFWAKTRAAIKEALTFENWIFEKLHEKNIDNARSIARDALELNSSSYAAAEIIKKALGLDYADIWKLYMRETGKEAAE